MLDIKRQSETLKKHSLYCQLLQGSVKHLLLRLQLLVLEELCVLRLGVVDSALGLVAALPATRTLVLASSDRLCRVPVTNALVALVQELVVRHVVGVNVLLNLGKRPVGERVDLDKSTVVDLNDVKVTTLASLASATSSNGSLDLEFRIRALSRLDLGNVVVVVLVGFPQLLAIACVEVLDSVAASRLVDVDGSVVPLADAVNQCVSLVKVEQGVQEDHVCVVLIGTVHLREHIKGNKTSQSKCSCLGQARQRCNAPFEDI